MFIRSAPFSTPLILLLAAAPLGAQSPGYNREVRPLLSDNCFHCHGPDQGHRKGGLRLDIRDEALKPAKSGKMAIVPGKPEESELLVRLEQTDPEEIMPPPESHKVLTAAQKATLRQWIAEGAKYEAHWAYTAIRKPEVPDLKHPSAIVLNPVDAFIQEPLMARGIAPSQVAGPAVLIRRLSLDLTGLPPSPDAVDAFVKDFAAAASPAVEKLVDRLLLSPHYGERMAQHWLDVVRYADTVGFHGDQNHNAWAYRDWVIAAFKANKKFDAFTREQLAGDLLPNPDESQWTATCFNRLTMMTREGGAQPKEYLTKYTADRVRTVGMAWLGATVGCAECHDHKFDPWRQKDFYSLGAFFADVKQWGVYNDYSYTPNPDLKGYSNDHPFPPERVVESPALKQRIKELEQEIRDALDSAAQALSAKPEKTAAFKSWAGQTAAFVTANSDGWTTPSPKVVESGGKTAGRKSPAAAEVSAATPVEAAGVEKDGRIFLAKGGSGNVEITLPVEIPALTAVRIELIPDARYGGSIARSGGSVTLKPAFHRNSAGAKKTALPVRFADADRKRPRYSNGFEILGVHDGWTSQEGGSKLPHRSVWLFQEPAHFEPGETLSVTLPDCSAGCLRISISPVVVTAEPEASLPPGFAASLGGADDVAMRWYLRCTPGDAVLKTVNELQRRIFACRGGRTPVMVTEKSDKPLTVRLLARGNWQDESGVVCEPVTPEFLPSLLPLDGKVRSRLDLANWLVDRSNPLTARVVMNRLWRQLFGNGLSAQTDDLGAQGEAPSHPELLDWLAAEFIDSGWDFRHMVRILVTSHTYRQSSLPRAETRDADPQNRWLASQNARRLEAEAVRDNVLTISGLLDPFAGGPPVKPYQPAGYYAGLQFPDRNYTADTGRDQWRRGIYTHWQRTFLHPMLANFDAPSREDCVALRTASNTPQQALTLLNDPSYVEAARVWAAELAASPGEDAARLDRAFRKALSRLPSAEERDGLLTFLAKARSAYQAVPGDAAKLLAVGTAPPPPEKADRVELAAWTSVCRVILNLHESITRY